MPSRYNPGLSNDAPETMHGVHSGGNSNEIAAPNL